MASVETKEMLAAAAAACEDKKAEDIRILALDPAESGLSDYFLICTGTNDRQTVAITDEIEQRLKRDFGTYPNSVEGRRQGEWILMDYVDFIVHVFLPEKRAFYGLERLRKSATTLEVADLAQDIKSAIEANRPAKVPAAKKSASRKSSVAAAVTPAEPETDSAETTPAPPKTTRVRASASKTPARKTAAIAAKTPAKAAKKATGTTARKKTTTKVAE